MIAGGIAGVIANARTAGRRFGGRLLDALLPPRCLGCRAAVDRQGGICAACWSGLAFLGPPLCACCGRPFEVATPEGTVCGDCLRDPPPFEAARAGLVYDDASRPLIAAFKYHDRTPMAPLLALWMARAGGELLVRADVIVPVPLHWTRLFTRRFNQSAMLAAELGRISGRPVLPDALVRRRRTRPQARLARAARLRNLRGAIAVHPRRAERLRGARVLLVDDVLTTGTTVDVCARVLRRGGAAAVDVLTVARVVRPEG